MEEGIGVIGIGVIEEDMCEFDTVDEECYFCGQPRTIRFSEHFTFCPNCSAIYTVHILQKSGCDHIKDGIPFVLRHPWYAGLKDDKAYIISSLHEDKQVCSICGKECIADGW